MATSGIFAMENGSIEKTPPGSADSGPVAGKQTGAAGRGERMSGEEFRRARLELGLSQQAMADRLGMRWQQSISRIETDGAAAIVSAHVRTLLCMHREYRETMAQAMKESK